MPLPCFPAPAATGAASSTPNCQSGTVRGHWRPETPSRMLERRPSNGSAFGVPSTHSFLLSHSSSAQRCVRANSRRRSTIGGPLSLLLSACGGLAKHVFPVALLLHPHTALVEKATIHDGLMALSEDHAVVLNF